MANWCNTQVTVLGDSKLIEPLHSALISASPVGGADGWGEALIAFAEDEGKCSPPSVETYPFYTTFTLADIGDGFSALRFTYESKWWLDQELVHCLASVCDTGSVQVVSEELGARAVLRQTWFHGELVSHNEAVDVIFGEDTFDTAIRFSETGWEVDGEACTPEQLADLIVADYRESHLPAIAREELLAHLKRELPYR